MLIVRKSKIFIFLSRLNSLSHGPTIGPNSIHYGCLRFNNSFHKAMMMSSSPWWVSRMASVQAEILLMLITTMMSPAAGQLGQYKLDINGKSSEGIFVTYFQVKMTFLLPMIIV